MKKLLVALMAVSMVLVAVSFAAAQSSSSTASVTSYQVIIPPGSASGTILGLTGPGSSVTFNTSASQPFPIQSFNPSATGADSGTATYEGAASGGGGQSAIYRTSTSTGSWYSTSQGGGASVSVSGFSY